MKKYKGINAPDVDAKEAAQILINMLAEACCVASYSCRDTNCKDCLFESDVGTEEHKQDILIEWCVDNDIISKPMAMELILKRGTK